MAENPLYVSPESVVDDTSSVGASSFHPYDSLHYYTNTPPQLPQNEEAEYAVPRYVGSFQSNKLFCT